MRITGNPPRVNLEDVPEDHMMIVIAGRKGGEVYMQHVMGDTVPMLHSKKLRGAVMLTLVAKFLAAMAALHDTHVEEGIDVPHFDAQDAVDEVFPKTGLIDANGHPI